MSTTVWFCSHCNATREVFEYIDDTHVFSRCRVCGYPVEKGAVDMAGVAVSRAKLLLIDDDKLLLTCFSDFAGQHGFQPLIAADGASGIALAKRERPDLILLDVVMPDMDGYEVCRQLCADPAFKEIAIVIITATKDPDLAVKSLRAGATLAMEKTTDSQRLLDTIKTALFLKKKPSAAL
jgi:twitching motility two-component system response regulator PilH